MVRVQYAYPNAGPRNGVKMYKLLPRARSDAGHVSLIVPAPMANAGEKNIPEKNRNIMSAVMFGAKPAPIVKMAPRGGEIKYTARRP